MNYKEIKDAFENVSIQHVEVKKFDFGESWESSVDGDGSDSYPKIFFETPIEGSINTKTKDFSFGLVCFIYPEEVYVRKDHFNAITWAHQILEEILTKIEADYKGKLSLDKPYSTVSFQLDTTSMLDGVRADITITTPNTGCVIEDKFNINRSNI